MRTSVILVSVIGLLALLAYQATGSRLSGDAASPLDIPIVGTDLSELVFLQPASYRGYEHPHGGGTITITGRATSNSVLEFCNSAGVSRSANGTNIADRTDILQYLEDREIKLPESTQDEVLDVLFGYGGRFSKLYGVYNGSTERFVISLNFHRSQ